MSPNGKFSTIKNLGLYMDFEISTPLYGPINYWPNIGSANVTFIIWMIWPANLEEYQVILTMSYSRITFGFCPIYGYV